VSQAHGNTVLAQLIPAIKSAEEQALIGLDTDVVASLG